jgi:RHS repeat-associated protein
MKLDYFQDGRFYNGLLSKQTWLADSVQRSYLYDYDKANRYTNAIFSGSDAENYNENAAYDVNGNILKLNRFGHSTSSGTLFNRIDSLTYSYSSNSNRLNGITDLANNTIGHKDNGNASDYTYYSDGSLKTDANKGITNIVYNYLGLPDEIIWGDPSLGSNGRIKNIYTADGQKLVQLLISGTDTIRTDYVGDLIYKNGILETVFHDEGRVRFDVQGIPHYQYFIQDHLGNNRIIFEKLNDSLFIAQRVDYYPFGSPHKADSLDFRFTYQGNEYINFFDYNTSDFNLRQYDSWRGQFNAVDPIPNFTISGYAAMLNNPLTYTDKNGD